MPLAFLTVIVVSKLTPHTIPAGTARSMVRLHTPEAVDVDRGLPPPLIRSAAVVTDRPFVAAEWPAGRRVRAAERSMRAGAVGGA